MITTGAVILALVWAATVCLGFAGQTFKFDPWPFTAPLAGVVCAVAGFLLY